MARIVAAALAFTIAAALAPPSNAANVLARGSTVDGQSIADWSAAWWTRFWQIPASAVDLGPGSGGTGSLAPNVDNNGPVYFAPITSGDPSVSPHTFNITVPYGVPVLVPVLMLDDNESAGVDGNAPLADRMHAADVTVDGWKNSVNTASLFATVDGSPVPDLVGHLEQTGYFDAGIAQPETNATHYWGVPVGDDLFPNKAAGYWLMIDDLSLGEHTFTYGGTSNAYTPEPNCCTNFQIGPFGVDVTTNIDVVVPEPASGLLLLAALGGLLAMAKPRGFRRHPS
jgi:hypothetical protein